MDDDGRVVASGAVAIDGSDIVAVDVADAIQQEFRGSETIDAAGRVVLPGLINTHIRALMVLCRGLVARETKAAGLRGVGVSHKLESNMKLASGTARW